MHHKKMDPMPLYGFLPQLLLYGPPQHDKPQWKLRSFPPATTTNSKGYAMSHKKPPKIKNFLPLAGNIRKNRNAVKPFILQLLHPERDEEGAPFP
jgi:hypothetical protein